MGRCALLLAFGVLVWPAAAQKGSDKPLTEEERALHALSRLTFGPTPGQVAQLAGTGVDRWIEAQLTLERDDRVEARLRERYPTLGLNPAGLRALQASRTETGGEGMAADIQAIYRESERDLLRAILYRATVAESQLLEVLADFWRNHFNVDSSKNSVQWLATNYEEAVIRKHVFGKFGDMLWDSAHHPAMLVYLDNSISRRPPSKSELSQIERTFRRRGSSRDEAREQAEIAKQRGLNENYARELMELHTLGVDNGYTQEDVEQVARAFTGWSVDLRQEEGNGFSYKDEMHDPSAKRVLGRMLPRGRGEEGIVEGQYVLRMLAGHRNTARFIGTKLVRYLVNDDPPESIVAAAAGAFAKSKGDLRETVAAIVQHPNFFDRKHFRAKFKTPVEFVVSTVRATQAEIADPEALVQAIRQLGMPLYACEDPTGYADTAEAWRDPGVMALRWKFALDLTGNRVRGVRVPDSFYYRLPEDPLDLMDLLIRRIVPSGLDENTHAVIERVVFRQIQSTQKQTEAAHRQLAQRITGILLGSPEFQQQ